MEHAKLFEQAADDPAFGAGEEISVVEALEARIPADRADCGRAGKEEVGHLVEDLDGAEASAGSDLRGGFGGEQRSPTKVVSDEQRQIDDPSTDQIELAVPGQGIQRRP